MVTLMLLKSLSFVQMERIKIEHELMLFHNADSPLIKLDFVKENSGNHVQFFRSPSLKLLDLYNVKSKIIKMAF